MRLSALSVLSVACVAACASTIGPVQLPVEVLVVLDGRDQTLRLIDLDNGTTIDTIHLSIPAGDTATALAVHGTLAAIGLGASNAVLIEDLVARRANVAPLCGPAPVTSLAFGDDGSLYVAVRITNTVAQVTLATYSPSCTAVVGGPEGFAVARGSVFAVAGNAAFCDSTLGTNCTGAPGFLIPLPADTGGSLDSISLGGPGNSSAAVAASDGLLYVLSSGDLTRTQGVLSKVDPVTRSFRALYGGFGPFPRFLASDGADRLYVASDTLLMVFSVSSQAVTRGPDAGTPGIPLQQAVAISTDEVGRLYVVQGAGCVAGAAGKVRVFGTDLIERQSIPVGDCPVAAAVTEIPANLFLQH